MPKVEDLLATLSNGKQFTKLDLRQAYQQLQLNDDSKEYVVINTTKGLFQYTRLPYGISSAPGIFQREMECLPGWYNDDRLGQDQSFENSKKQMLVHGTNCVIPGHRIDADGLHPLTTK